MTPSGNRKNVSERLIAMLSEVLFEPEGPLPTVGDLCRLMRSSRADIQKALKQLLAEGLIQQHKPGARYYSAHTSTATVTGLKDARWMVVSKRLQEEIFAGKHDGMGGLPTFHALGQRLGCSLTTMVKVVGHLESQGIVRRQGRRFLPMERGSKRTAGSSIVFASSENALSAYQSHGFPFVRVLERELRRREWGQLHMALSNTPDEGTLPPPHLTGGIIYLPGTHVKGWGPLFRSRAKFPLVVVNLQEEIRGQYPGFTHFFRLLPDNRFAGFQMAQWMLQRGHVHCAFFSHLSDHPRWAALRLQGVKQVFTSEFCRECIGPPDPPKDSSTWLPNAKLQRFADILLQELHLPSSLSRTLFHLPQTLAANQVRLRKMRESFEAVFRNEKITAWICVNDDLAVCARAFLMEQSEAGRGRKVELAGFDNSPLSYSLRFTSYDFDMESMALMAIQALERPGEIARLAPNQCYRVRGHLIARS